MNDKKAIAIILLTTAIIMLLMLPLREQVFSDDFAYAQSVRHLLNTGDVKVSEFLAPSSILFIIWGSMFSKILGFSFTSLHFSQIIALPILTVFIYKILREVDLTVKRSLIFTLFFLSIPWIIQFTFTFMTNVFFLTLEVISIFFYFSGLKRGEKRKILLGSIFASLAFLIRQIGMILPFAVILAILTSDRDSSTSVRVRRIIYGVFIPIVVFFWYFWWASQPNNKTITQIQYEGYFRQNIETLFFISPELWKSKLGILQEFIHRSLNYLSQLMGLFFALTVIFVLLRPCQFLRNALRRRKITFLAVTVAIFIYGLDVLLNYKNYTVGFPLILYQYEVLFPIPWENLWKFIVGLSIPIWAILVSKSISNNFLRSRLEYQFLSFSFVGIFVSTLLSPHHWEEYVMPLLPYVLIWYAVITRRIAIPLKLAVFFITILLIDSLQMSKLRYDEGGISWEIALRLKDQGIPIEQINPNRNYFWNSWFKYEQDAADAISRAGGDKRMAKLSFEYRDPTYFIATNRQIKWVKYYLEPYLIEKIKFRSLFVETELKIFKNEQGFLLK